MKKYALYIGRWQNWHKGHEWLINQQLEKGKNCWVAIRDVQQDENNPKTAQQILKELSHEPFFQNNSDKILLSIIPSLLVSYPSIVPSPSKSMGIRIFSTTTSVLSSFIEFFPLSPYIWLPF